MTNQELIAKFRANVEGALSNAVAENFVDAVMNLEKAEDVGAVMRKLGSNMARSTQRAAE
jgi:hypothetical protein